jgi:hypothetical protein
MSQAGYTPIQLYFSTTAAAVPVNTNLANGELAINITDEKLYFKNAAGVVKLLASNATSAPVLSFSAGTTGFTPNTATSGAITLAGTLATTNGGTGLTAFTANQVFYASSTSAFAQSANLTFNGTTLTANTIGAFTLGGTIAGGGNQINNVIIGTTTPLAGAFTTITANGTAATNTTALTAQGTTTGFNRGRIFNTGGDLRFGIDSSVGAEAVAGSAAYSSFIGSFTNTPFYLVSNSAIVGTVSSTGLAVTGTLSTSGAITVNTTALVSSGTNNIGINTASPLTNGATFGTLTINGSNGGAIQFATAGVSIAQVYNDSNSLFINPNTGKTISLQIASSTVASVSSTGLAVTGTLSASGAITNTAGTANGVTYLNGSKVLTSGTTLTFDGTDFVYQGAGAYPIKLINNDGAGRQSLLATYIYGGSGATGTLNLSSTYGNANQTRIIVGVSGTTAISFQGDSVQRFQFGTAGQFGIGATPSYGTAGQVLTSGGSAAAPTWTTVSSGGGDVVGPSSSTDNALARFDTTTGKLLQNSVGILSDAGALSGLTTIDTSNAITLTKSSAIILTLGSGTGQTSSTGTVGIVSDGLGGGADTRSGFMFTGRNTSGTLVSILELSGASGAAVTGTLSVTTGAAVGGATAGAGGLAFPATAVAVANANTLDDYEEGTFTPAITGINSVTYTQQYGNYVKIGKQVTAYVRLLISGGTGNGAQVSITGLPFTSAAANGGGNGGGAVGYKQLTALAFYPHVNESGTQFDFYLTETSAPTGLTLSGAQSGYLMVFVTYPV